MIAQIIGATSFNKSTLRDDFSEAATNTFIFSC